MNFLLASAAFKTGVMIIRKEMNYVLGRSRNCDIFVPSTEASRKHALIAWQGNTFYLKDQGSANGTLLNEKPVDGVHFLKDGDVIGVGAVRFTFRTVHDDLTAIIEHYRGDSAMTDAIHAQGPRIKGKFQNQDLFEMVQLLEFQEKTGLLRVSSNKEYGEMAFSNGMIVEAKFKSDLGIFAALALLRFPRGNYEFEEAPQKGDGNTNLQPSVLIMEVAKENDENLMDDDDENTDILDQNPFM